jgi:hypothetical protein
MPGGSAPSARTRWALRRSEPAPSRVCRRRLHFDSGVDSAWYRRRHRMIRAGRRRSMRVTASPKSITTCGIARLQPAAKPLGAHFRGAMVQVSGVTYPCARFPATHLPKYGSAGASRASQWSSSGGKRLLERCRARPQTNARRRTPARTYRLPGQACPI